ncbi:winged helix DNA-binding domain-containing protein [Actinoplanes sp. TBRC 11911]|uniref:winged helix DNA-binding domain-containing protein n=1 Tax=Actinoplanes sp. TBRC 11911 TaxID=2729386 RepID=UPI00145E996D|nr:winged helix DNA-binding domain-containing protein [Actinoplanes sp. TBRC 11911]NMO56390.1 winged helix DNA-binding domain-containing protein [Actinoplanes sp. TBRC 11911]
MTTGLRALRALNRATLARQLLLRRADISVPEALSRVGGLQAQTAQTWYVGLWTRLAGYSPAATSDLLADGLLVRMALMRGTIHLVAADDARWLRPLVDPVIHRGTMGAFGRDLRDVDRDELAALARKALAERPMTFTELGRELAVRWPGRDPLALGNAARAWLPLAQSPPRGLWGRRGKAAHHVFPAPLIDAPVDRLVLSYLSAFGPATVLDCQQWSGLTRLAEVFERLRPSLVALPGGYFDLPDAPRPDPETPAPVRFLYDFDNLLLSHDDRRRVLGDVDYTSQGWGGGNMEMPRSLLVDGFVAATWKETKGRLTVRPFRRLTARERAEISAEGAQLLAFLAPDAPHEIAFRDD